MVTSLSARASCRVLLVEDHVLFAEALELALGLEGYNVHRMAVPDHDRTPGLFVSGVVRKRPDIVLLDLDLGPFGDGTRLIGPLARTGVKVVVVTASSDRSRWGLCLGLGARQVLAKAQPLNEILRTVRRLHEGLPVIDHQQREELLTCWRTTESERRELGAKFDKLTPREQKVLGELTEGHTVREIARLSVVSEATVRTQVKSILAKLEVSSQLAAVGIAHQISWRAPHP